MQGCHKSPWSTIRGEIMALFFHFLTSSCIFFGGQFFEKTYWILVGSVHSHVMTNFSIEDFREIALAQATHEPSCWFCGMDDTFLIWPHGPEKLKGLLYHLYRVHQNIHFTIENDRVDHFPSLALTFAWDWWPSGSRDLLKIHEHYPLPEPWLTAPIFQQVGQSIHLGAQEHSFSRKYHIQLRNTKILSIKSHYMHSVIRVVTMILHHLNRMNKEDALVLSRSLKPLIQTLREKRKPFPWGYSTLAALFRTKHIHDLIFPCHL